MVKEWRGCCVKGWRGVLCEGVEGCVVKRGGVVCCLKKWSVVL